MKKLNAKKIIIILVAILLVVALALTHFVFIPRHRYACAYAKQISASSVANIEKTTLVSHRGIATEAPENTLPAYELAAKKGFKYAETDIRATADGVWVLTHDNSLKRMTGFSGKCEEMTFSEVRSHPVTKGANAKDYKNLVTPTFEEYLALCAKNSLTPVVEIKTAPETYDNPPYKDILISLQKYKIKDAIIISFSYSALESIRQYDENIKLLLLCKEIDEDIVKNAAKINCGIDCSFEAFTKNTALAKDIVGSGMELGVWTVDKKDDAEKAINAGVKYLTTNAIMPKG